MIIAFEIDLETSEVFEHRIHLTQLGGGTTCGMTDGDVVMAGERVGVFDEYDCLQCKREFALAVKQAVEFAA